MELVEGGVYRWNGAARDEKYCILNKLSNDCWSMIGVRHNGIHHWNTVSNTENATAEQILEYINQGTFVYVCKLGEVFYGSSR